MHRPIPPARLDTNVEIHVCISPNSVTNQQLNVTETLLCTRHELVAFLKFIILCGEMTLHVSSKPVVAQSVPVKHIPSIPQFIMVPRHHLSTELWFTMALVIHCDRQPHLQQWATCTHQSSVLFLLRGEMS